MKIFLYVFWLSTCSYCTNKLHRQSETTHIWIKHLGALQKKEALEILLSGKQHAQSVMDNFKRNDQP